MEILPIDITTRKAITNVWNDYFIEFDTVKPLRIIKVFDFFVLSIELRIIMGNKSYEPSLQLYSLTQKDFKFSCVPIFNQAFRDPQGLWLWIHFEEPIETAQKYFNFISKQTILPLFGSINYDDLIKKIKYVIEQGVVLTNIGTPYRQYEFLIHSAAMNPNKIEGLKLFELSIAELKKFKKESLTFFVKDVDAYFHKLEEEFNNPEILRSHILENKKKLKVNSEKKIEYS